MRNKGKGFSLVELVISLALLGAFMTIIGQANSIFVGSLQSVKSLIDNSGIHSYALSTIISEVKSSNGTFEVETDSLRIYHSDGTYKVIEEKYKSLYIDSERVAPVVQCKFTDEGNSIRAQIIFKDYPKIDVTVYKPKER